MLRAPRRVNDGPVYSRFLAFRILALRSRTRRQNRMVPRRQDGRQGLHVLANRQLFHRCAPINL